AAPASRLDAHAFAVDGSTRNPAVDAAAVVADLVALALDRLDEMQILAAVHLAQHDVADLERAGRRHDGAELAGLDLARHRVAARPELHTLAALQLSDVQRRPAHRCAPLRRHPRTNCPPTVWKGPKIGVQRATRVMRRALDPSGRGRPRTQIL